jgi:1,4-dihydroxy-2-naphthoate octaprenyltransferase
LVAVGATYFVQAGGLHAGVMLLAVPIGLLTANILVVNNYRDADTDRMAAKRTLVVILGRRFARVQHGASLALAMLVLPVAAWRFGSNWLLLPWLMGPVAWRQCRQLARAGEPAELIALLGATGRLLAGYALLLAAGLILTRI